MIHNWRLFSAVIAVAILQATAAVLGGKLTHISLPPRYRRRYRGRAKLFKWLFYLTAVLLCVLTICGGIINDHIQAVADKDNANLHKQLLDMQQGVDAEVTTLRGIALQVATNAPPKTLPERANSATANIPASSVSRKNQITGLELQQTLDKIANNLTVLSQSFNPSAPHTTVATPQPSTTHLTPSVLGSSAAAPEQHCRPSQAETPGLWYYNPKPYSQMTVSELRTELQRCMADVREIRVGTYAQRSDLVHEVVMMAPSGIVTPDLIRKFAPQVEEFNKQDIQSYEQLRGPIAALRKAVLARLQKDTQDEFIALDKKATTLPSPPSEFYQYNTSEIFDSVAAYLNDLDNRLAKLPQK